MIKVVPQNFFPNIWCSPAFKFRLHPKMVRQNGAEKNLNACKIQTTGSRDFKYGLKGPPETLVYDKSCCPKFSPYIWGSPAIKFQLRPKMVGQNAGDENLNAYKIQTTGSRDFK